MEEYPYLANYSFNQCFSDSQVDLFKRLGARIIQMQFDPNKEKVISLFENAIESYTLPRYENYSFKANSDEEARRIAFQNMKDMMKQNESLVKGTLESLVKEIPTCSNNPDYTPFYRIDWK